MAQPNTYPSTAALLAVLMPALSLAAPQNSPAPLAKRYQGGWCGMDVTQYFSDTNDLTFDFRVYDAIRNEAGGGNSISVPVYGSQSLPIEGLPDSMEITVGYTNDDPLQFSYNGDTFTADQRCGVGKYDGGNRDMDCGFTC